MKTLQEHQKARAKRIAERRAALRKRIEGILEIAEAAGLPEDELDASRAKVLRERLRSAADSWPTGIACDRCGTELVFPRPNRRILTNPAKREVACAGCGFRGTVILS